MAKKVEKDLYLFPDTILYREQWLLYLAKELETWFDEHGYPLPTARRITCGWPLGNGLRVIGQCWPPSLSADKTIEIFISPVLAESDEVGGTLAHELLHAALPENVGHRGKWITACKKIDLTQGRPKSAGPGDLLKAHIAGLARKLGPYPHAKISPKTKTKQTTRMIKVVCPDEECACIVRMSAKCLESPGPPTCACGMPMDAAE